MNKDKSSGKANFKNYIVNKRIRDYLDKQANVSSPKQSVKEFSEAVGVTPENVRQWINGYSRPDIDKLTVIADYMGCSLEYLLGKTEITNHEQVNIVNELNLTIDAISNLKDMKSIDFKNSIKHSSLFQDIPEDFKYTNIISYFICQRELWEIIQEQLLNIDKYNKDDTYKEIYLKLSKKKGIYMPAKDFACMNISSEISKILNDYVEKKYRLDNN